MFLTNKQLETLTGYRAAAWQSKWLTQRGVRHTRNGAGKVVVLESAVQAMYGYGNPSTYEPNFSALNAPAKA